MRLEGGFERGGRIRVAECLRQIVPDRWASIRKRSFPKCFCVYTGGDNAQTPCYLADLSEDTDVTDEDDGDREEEGQSHLVQVGVKHHVDSFVVPVTQAVAPVRHHHYEAEHLRT